MEIFNKIPYNNGEINDVWNIKQPKINTENLKNYNVLINDRLDSISNKEYQTTEFWWLTLILNPDINPFKLNIDNGKIFSSIQKTLHQNPINVIRDSIYNSTDVLMLYISQYYQNYIIDDNLIFQYENLISTLYDIRLLIKQYPRKEDLSITYYEYNKIDELTIYKRKIHNWCISNNFYSLYNRLNTNLINKFIFHIRGVVNKIDKFTYSYNGTYYQANLTDSLTNIEISSRIANNISSSERVNDIIFTDSEIKYNSISFNSNKLNTYDVLNYIYISLKYLSNWSKNGI